MTIHSGLGQPLRAEIELLALDKDELGSLSARIASSEAFQQAGIPYSAELTQLKLAVDKNSRGQPVIVVTSARPFNEPFLDLLVELSWSSGRIVREYTALLDPPDVGIPLSPPVAPQAEKIAEPRLAGQPAPQATADADEYGPVKTGDTLSKIAREVKPANINLEQALVSLYRANPQAFSGNMNRLKTGQILRVPEAGEFAALSKSEALAEVRAQTADWNAYRQKLGLAPVMVADAGSPQSASGKISVADSGGESAPSNEVLRISRADTLPASKAQSSGALQEKIKALEEEVVAKEQEVKEANERVAILEKQIDEMKRLVELKGQVPGTETAAAPASAAKPEAAAAAEQKPAAQKPAAPKVEDSTSWLDELMQNPLYLAALALVVVLAALFAVKAMRRRKHEESNILVEEQALAMEQEDVEEPQRAAPETVTVASSSEEMDPLAEAEVYLAYDREQQAEEILKDGIKKTPGRHELYLKLLDIYSRRKDFASFNSLAQQLHGLTGGMGPAWERAAAMGIALAPNNPLYAQEEQAEASPAGEVVDEHIFSSTRGEPATTVPELDFETSEDSHAGLQTEPVFAADETLVLQEKEDAEHHEEERELSPEKLIATIDFNAERHHLAAAETDLEQLREETADEKLDLVPRSDLSFAPDEPAAGNEGGQAEDLSFAGGQDLSDIDLNFEDQPSPSSVQDEIWQQVETKFDLARAYQEMGEKEGAREILEEVIKDGDAKQQRAARSMLANL